MISLVSTVLNDRKGTAAFFSQMVRQTRFPEEIVVVDGGSRDGTWELLQEESQQSRPWKLIAIREEGCNVARGRNLAIAAASHDLIATTDIGCDWDPEWLEELMQPFAADPSIEVVIGSWGVKKAELVGPWAKTEFALKGDIMQTSSSPETQSTSRSIAYRRELWERLKGYPEDLTLAVDDTVFDLQIKRDRARVASAPLIRCYWHRHESLKAFLKEQYRYFYGNGEANLAGRHFLLVGTRLGLELVGLVAGTFLFILPVTRWLGVVAWIVSLGSILLRFRRWLPAARRLAGMEVDHPLVRVAIFETLCRIHSLRSWPRGWWRGFKSCQACRARLAPMPLENSKR